MPISAAICIKRGGMDAERFEAARRRILKPEERQRHGIGMQAEKTLHAVLKSYYDPDEDHQEIPVEGFIADIFDGRQIIEIQNGGFFRMRDKLAAFLPQYPVRIVYPIPHIKYVNWINPETGEQEKRSKSPKKGSFYQVFRELFGIRAFLAEPGLTIDLLLVDMDEYRLRDGRGQDGKRGSHRFDRIPTALAGELVLASPRDYLAFLPYELPAEFTASELEAASGARLGRRESFASVLRILEQLGLVERTGEKKGRSYLWRIKEPYASG